MVVDHPVMSVGPTPLRIMRSMVVENLFCCPPIYKNQTREGFVRINQLLVGDASCKNVLGLYVRSFVQQENFSG